MSTNASPRFQRTSLRGFEHSLADPLPSTLAGLIADRAEQHRKVAARLDELRSRRVELARKLAESEQADENDAREAALAGRAPKRRQRTASARGALEECEAEVRAFEQAVEKSANKLLEAAIPKAGAAITKAAEARERAVERARELLAALDGALAEVGDLGAERVWLRRLDGGARSIEPFRGAGADPGLGRLRRVIADAFGAWEVEEASRQAEVDRQKAYEDEHAAEWARKEEQAKREAAEARVRYEDGVLTHRGGRPVRPGFQDAEEDR
jgi:hypothetical protein